MVSRVTVWALALLLPAGALGTGQAQEPAKSLVEEADSHFRAGRFSEARQVYLKAREADSKNAALLVSLGKTALLAGKLDTAEEELSEALSLDSEDRTARLLLAEAFYRRDHFARAAELFRAAGREALAGKLESFKGRRPYEVPGDFARARIPFVQTDPLPLVQVRVNGSEPGYFLIDTGGSEVILDDEFAKSVGAPDFGAETGTFAGGQRAPVHQSSIESLQLGELEVRNVPAHILSTRRFSAVAQGKRVDGILGTILFYHFRTTLDYRTGELILERRTGQAASPPAGAVVMPFWMGGDHLMLAWGRMNGAGPFLWFVDTGLAGPGFTGPRATITEAGIELPSQPTAQGQGGGGRVSVTPFAVAELSLGDAAEKNIVGVFGPFPESLEMSHGFRIAGIISHQFFRRYAVTFDFDAMQLILVRSS